MAKGKTLIVERLRKYTELLKEIDMEERRKNALHDDGTLIYRRAKAGICDNLKRLLDKEQVEYEILVEIINALPCVEQRQVMFARYMDGQSWRNIAAAIFGDKADYAERADSYLRRVHRIHGTALKNANRILEKKERGQIFIFDELDAQERG